MILRDVTEKLGLEVLTGSAHLEREVTGGYAGDLLSDVMANAVSGQVWLTIQTHQNVVAVAALAGLAGVVITAGKKPEADTLQRADSEGVVIMRSPYPTFRVAGELWRLLGGAG
ncbi:MAG: DRTGG domain-containing protein [Bacillota bacterium]|nr:DRTGG domain-containing protein [Bacillota bacterium]